MNSNKQITIKRLQKQQIGLEKEPIPGVLVKRDGFLNFYFCIFGLDQPYKGGYYYGLLQLHENYPFAAPKLFFYTRSGRFQTNMSICTSFTSYHQESWTSAWNVRSLIIATISFMTSEQPSYGCRNDPTSVRKRYAQISLEQNMKSEKFRELFGDELKKKGVEIPQNVSRSSSFERKLTSEIDESFEQEQEEMQNNIQNEPNMEEVLIPEPGNQEEQQRNRRNTVIKVVIGGIIVIGLAITGYVVFIK